MLCATLVALALTAGAVADAALKVTLSGAGSFVGVANAVVTATVTNTGDEPIKVLNDPSSVLGTAATNSFDISNGDGTRPRFKGVVVKYVPDLNLDVTTLEPGKSVSVKHSLASAYDFSVSGPGVYTIDASPLVRIVSEGRVQDSRATVVAYSARLSGNLVAQTTRPVKLIAFNGCSSPRQRALTLAAQSANQLVVDALGDLTNSQAAPGRFTKWFGPRTPTARATVQGHFGALANLKFGNFTYDCTCVDPTAAAQTNPDVPAVIQICPRYFVQKTTGADSQAGILIQQAVQWNNVAAASAEFAVGVDPCLALAVTHPDLALENADSHEYYAENPDV